MNLKLLLTPALILFAYGLTPAAEPAADSVPIRENKTPSVSLPANPKLASVIFNDAGINEAARLLTSAVHLPIVVSQEAAKTRISIYLKNIPAMDALDAICRSSGLWCQQDPTTQIITIQTLKEFKESIQLVGKDAVDVVQIMYPDASDIGDAVKQLFVNKVNWERRDQQQQNYKTEKIEKAIERMDLLADRGVFGLSGQNDAYSGGGSASRSPSSYGGDSRGSGRYANSYGGGFSSYTTGGTFGAADPNSPVTAGEEAARELEKANRAKLEAMIRSIGGKAAATFADVSNNPGIVYLSVLPESNSLMLRSADPTALKQVRELINKLDKPLPQVLLEVKILSVRIDDTHERALDFLFKSGDYSGGFAGGMPSTGGGSEIVAPDANMSPQGAGTNTKAATFNAISKNFAVRFQMLKTDDRLTELATPNLLVSDNEASTFFLGNEVTVMEKAQKTTTYIQTTDAGAYLPNVNWEITAPRRQVGTSVLITPKIHPDRSVTIRLMQEQSNLGPERINTFSASSGTVSESQTFISQDISLQNLTTTVIAQDQNLVVIGGLITEGVTKYAERVPWFSEIPYFGELLFSRMKEGRTRNEILVIIRPFVLLAPGEADSVSRDFIKRISQHPSAKGDIPSLGVNYPKDIAKPRNINPNDPWLLRTWDTVRDWSVDDITPPDIESAAYDANLDADNIRGSAEVKGIQDKINRQKQLEDPAFNDADLKEESGDEQK